MKTLSFAGRLQLLGSVISGVVKFWISTFLLPQGCIKKIESLCSRFLWNGSIDKGKGAKVSWKAVCLPKNEGGLGLRRYAIWNKALSLRYVWLLFSDQYSLWADWNKNHHLRGENFWSVKESSRYSWIWNSLLKLRPLAETFIRCNVGNGRNTSFWYDFWTSLGPIIKSLGTNGPRDLRLPLNCSVAATANGEGWSLPAPRSDAALSLHIHLTIVQHPHSSLAEDYYSWEMDDSNSRFYSSAKTWGAIRPRNVTQDWVNSVWFKGNVLKHAFNMWVAHLDRLPTRQRLSSWGMNIPTYCCLCSASEESRDYIFVTCVFAAEIWSLVLSRIDQRHGAFCTWAELLSWTRLNSKAASTILRKIVSQAYIFHVWKQRNNILHNQHSITPQSIFKCIDRDIKRTSSHREERTVISAS